MSKEREKEINRLMDEKIKLIEQYKRELKALRRELEKMNTGSKKYVNKPKKHR